MALPSRHALRVLATTLAGALTLLAVTVLACGPAAPGEQNVPAAEPTATIPWLGTPPTESELATLEALPTATPYPPGYVKPTEPPYVPPLTDAEVSATFTAELATEAAEQPRGVAAPPDTPPPTPTPLPLTEQVTQFAHEMRGKYDVVARVRAGASRVVAIPDGVVWPNNTKPWGEEKLVRTPISAITTYYGALPAGYELVTPGSVPNATLESGQEYVLFIRKAFADQSDKHSCSGTPVPGHQCYNQAQLAAMGGGGGFFFGAQFWIVSEDRAWQIPSEHIRSRSASSDLAAAKAGGETLPLSDLEVAIQAGLPE